MGCRQTIDGAGDLPQEKVHVPEWGCAVLVCTMSGVDREAYEMDNLRRREAAKGQGAWYAGYKLRLLVRVLRDPDDGSLLYQPGEEEVLGRRSPRVLERLFAIADRLNATTEAAVEDRAGKSEAAPGGSSSTDSPSPSGATTPTTS